MRILTYTLPREHLAYERLVRAVDAENVVVSDHRDVADIWVMGKFYQHYEDPRLEIRIANPPSDETMSHIVYRDRWLRLLPFSQARRMVLAGYAALVEIFDQVNPDAVICRPVDYYLNDIAMRIVEERGLPCFSQCESQAPGHSLLTHRGEWNPYREVADQEVDALLAEYRQPSHHRTYFYRTAGSFIQQARSIAEHKLRTARRLALRSWYRDPLNFHYALHTFDNIPRRMIDFPRDEFSRALVQRTTERPRIFMPLGWTPEMSTDYWCPGFEAVSYLDFVLALTSKLGRDFDIVVKDHPNIVGMRPIEFTRSLATTAGVTMIDPRVPATSIMDECDLTLVGTGTPGIQALARGKPVIRFGHVFWATEENSLFLAARTLLQASNAKILEAMHQHTVDRNRTGGATAIRQVLESSIPGSLMYRKGMGAMIDDDVSRALPHFEAIVTGRVKRSPLVVPERMSARDVISSQVHSEG